MLSADCCTIRKMEAEAISSGIPEYTLMLRAGIGAARIIDRLFSNASRFVILSGGGNNGGDALVAAANLHTAPVVVYSSVRKDKLSGCAACAANDLPPAIPFEYREQLSPADILPGDVIIDGLLGIGFSGGYLRNNIKNFIETANFSKVPIVALDLPSGIDSNSGKMSDDGAIKAVLTLTFGAVKTGLLQNDGTLLAGAIRVIDIGLGELIRRENALEVFTNIDAVRSWQDFPADCHKNSRGRVAGWGGSAEYSGAPVLSGRGALYGGAGLVKIFSTANFSGNLPNALIVEKLSGSQLPETDNFDTLVCGCGWGSCASEENLRSAWNFPGPLVLDADGLNALAKYHHALPLRNALILTPHPGEAGRLAEACGINYSSRKELALKLSEKFQAVTLLKGHNTVIAAPDGKYTIIASGSALLATAGSGDVLAGVIGALAARNGDLFGATALGAYIHGIAGEFNGQIISADDLPEMIGRKIRLIAENRIF